MSVVGSSLETSALLAAQAQHVASKARDREKSESATGRRFQDLVELRVGGVETGDGVRGLPSNDSEQGDHERDSRRQQQGGYAHVVDDHQPPQPIEPPQPSLHAAGVSGSQVASQPRIDVTA